MDKNTDKKIRTIASKLKIQDKFKKIEAAQSINQLAILLIEMAKKR